VKLTERFEYPAAPDQVFALVSDPTFREESCRHQGARDYDVAVTVEGDRTVITIERTMESDMPDFIKKLTGDSVTVTQIEKWGPADAAGTRTADVTVDIHGQPARMRGTSTISASGAATVMTLDGDVKVSLPLIGKRIEPEVAKAISASLREEVEFGTTRL
jgi:C-terminal processing protease CtpA/Prc